MVTLGVGALIRGLAQLLSGSVPGGILLPIPSEPLVVNDLRIPADKLVAALVAASSIALVAWFHQRSRTGVALRAIADDQQAAMAVGINVSRHLLIVWCIASAICMLGGTLCTSVTKGGFGLRLVGFKIFPIVIIGGLDSIPGTIVAAILIGVVESLATGYRIWVVVAVSLPPMSRSSQCYTHDPLGSSAESKWSEYRHNRQLLLSGAAA